MKIESSSIVIESEHLSSIQIQEERRAERNANLPTESSSKEDISLSNIITEQIDFSSFNKDEAIFLRDVSTAIIEHIRRFRSVQNGGSDIELKYPKTTPQKPSIGQVFDSSKMQPINKNIFNQVITKIEGERLSYNVDGIVKTQYGQEIDINIELNLSREFIENFDKNLVFSDPLVINYNASTAQLTNKKFAFDIDSDGVDNQISILRSGSGYLSLDRNGNGKINDGSELFGTKSGDGFADLALYDGDNNGWIDENDAIFKKLRVWVKDSDSEDKLLALGEVGVGAIYLVNSDTEFTLTNETGVAGRLKQSSIFIKENGDVGIIQNIDHALKEKGED